ncbi:MAG: hypothetical protein R3350_09420 [Saprospiraceae bacterium]|nr:hypothetical protein [Saprospiraceae bacterium]
MQDKRYDRDLMDRGWSQMQDLLDREMPVGLRRRRWAGWLVLALLLFALVGGISIQNERTDTGQQAGKPVIPEVDKRNALSDENTSGPQLAVGQQSLDEQSRTEAQNRSAESGRNPTVVAETKTEQIAFSGGPVRPIPSIISEWPATEIGNADPAGLPGGEEEKSPDFIFPPLDPLPFRSGGLLSDARPHPSLAKPVVGRSKANLYGEITMGSMVKDDFPSFWGAGFALEHQIPGSRWLLKPGIGLLNSRHLFRSGDAEPLPSQESPGQSDPNLGQSQVTPNARLTFWQVEARFMVAYRLAARWQLALGPDLHYILSGNLSRASFVREDFFQADRQYIPGLTPGSGDQLSLEDYRRLNPGARLGIGYRISGRLRADAYFRYGLGRMTADGDFQNRNSRYGLGIGYRLTAY